MENTELKVLREHRLTNGDTLVVYMDHLGHRIHVVVDPSGKTVAITTSY